MPTLQCYNAVVVDRPEFIPSDCMSNDFPACELFIVRAGPVASMCKIVRDRLTQAILPLYPSIIEIADADFDQVLDDNQVKWIVSFLGVGIEVGGPPVPRDICFTLESLRYYKVILVAEESPESSHLNTQVLTFMHRFNYPLLAAGHVYVVPPEDWLSMSEHEFAAKAMNPSSRHSVQVRHRQHSVNPRFLAALITTRVADSKLRPNKQKYVYYLASNSSILRAMLGRNAALESPKSEGERFLWFPSPLIARARSKGTVRPHNSELRVPPSELLWSPFLLIVANQLLGTRPLLIDVHLASKSRRTSERPGILWFPFSLISLPEGGSSSRFYVPLRR